MRNPEIKSRVEEGRSSRPSLATVSGRLAAQLCLSLKILTGLTALLEPGSTSLHQVGRVFPSAPHHTLLQWDSGFSSTNNCGSSFALWSGI